MELSQMSKTAHPAAAQETLGTPSAQAWFAGGERVGYDPRTRATLRRKTRPSGFS